MSSVTSEKTSAYSGAGARQNDTLNLMGDIESIGYAHIKGPISHGEFEALSQQLGAIVYRTDLHLTEGRKSVVYKFGEIGSHMDNPHVHIIGWYCVKQDESDGSSLLVDVGDIERYFSQPELAVLQTVNVRCTHPVLHDPEAGKEVFFLSPLLSWRGATPQIYFVNWHLLDSYDKRQANVLDKFKGYLRQKQERELIRVRLKENEALFINNRRILHGRGRSAGIAQG